MISLALAVSGWLGSVGLQVPLDRSPSVLYSQKRIESTYETLSPLDSALYSLDFLSALPKTFLELSHAKPNQTPSSSSILGRLLNSSNALELQPKPQKKDTSKSVLPSSVMKPVLKPEINVILEDKSIISHTHTNIIQLNNTYSKDKYGVYFENQNVENAGIYSFEVLNDFYGKDVHYVYYKTKPLKNADKDSFQITPLSHLALDKNNVYYRGEIQHAIDRNNFSFVDSIQAQDQRFLYYEEAETLRKIPKFGYPLPTPETVKGIYIHAYNFVSPVQRQKYLQFFDSTVLNTAVIDIKDAEGKLLFPPTKSVLSAWPISKSSLSRSAFQEALEIFQSKNVYTIARITTFQEPSAVSAYPHLGIKDKNGQQWKNFHGIDWFDPTKKEVWNLVVAQAKEAFDLGFDEVQFDYIRFPSDGYISRIDKSPLQGRKRFEVLQEFFQYIDENLNEYPQPISLDLFGLTYRQYEDESYDLGIGQRLVDTLPYFDYLSPMIYPSHYGEGHFGIPSPINSPYLLLKESLHDGHSIIENAGYDVSKSRPWIQDFTLHGVKYNAQEVTDQIQAVQETNASGFLLWNARNVYTTQSLLE